MSINRLIPNPPGEIINGEILYNGEDLLQLSYDEMSRIRGKDISMIFQEPIIGSLQAWVLMKGCM